MRPMFRLALLAPFVLALTGCITSETLIKLKADGSGTLEQVMLVNVRALEGVPEMMAGLLGGKATSSSSSSSKKTGGSAPLEMFDENKLRSDVEKFGPGVRFVSAEKLTRDGMEGGRVIYAFDDINQLVVDQEPPAAALGGGSNAGAQSDPLRFGLARLPNGRSMVTVRFDEPAGSPKAPKGAPAPKMAKGDMPEGMQEMMETLLDGFRVSIDIEVDGAIAATSSPFVDGSRVTVLEMDLGRLVKDPNGMKVLERLNPEASVSEMIPVLKDVRGIRVNASPLTIEFAGR
jgi:hypothetical protein